MDRILHAFIIIYMIHNDVLVRYEWKYCEETNIVKNKSQDQMVILPFS